MKEEVDYVHINEDVPVSAKKCRFPLFILALALVAGSIIIAFVFMKAKTKTSTFPTVTLPSGAVLEGRAEKGVEQWLGVRYASPPVGERRWAPPLPFDVPSGSYDRYGSSCLQVSTTMNMSEDCLFLNIFRPQQLSTDSQSSGLLPVFFWVHGGGYLSGHAETYPGEHLAKFESEYGNGVILVTINYRVAMLGFLSLPGQTDVNFGLRDQIAALQWTRENIKAFGGDPDKITIGGESAGGGSVCWHYANPRLSFIKGVIAESPAPWMGTFYRASSDQRGVDLATRFFNCSVADALSCMRNVSASTLLKVMSAYWITRPEFDVSVVVDYDVVQGPASDIFNSSHNKLPSHIPILIGSNNNEGNLFAFFNAQYSVNETKDQFDWAIKRRYGHAAKNVTLWLQHTLNTSTYFAADARIEGQEIVSCGCEMVAKAAPVAYSYVFGTQTQNPATLPFLGSTHSTEMHFVFGAILLESSQLPLEGNALTFSQTVVMPLWMRFIYGQQPWLVYNQTIESMMYFSENYTNFLSPPSYVTDKKWDLCREIIGSLYVVS